MLIKCIECGKEISDKAKNCPNCGCPIEDTKINQIKKDKAEKTVKKNNSTIKKEKSLNGCAYGILGVILMIFVFILSSCFSGTRTVDTSSSSDSVYTAENTPKQGTLLVPMANDLTKEKLEKDLERTASSISEGDSETYDGVVTNYFSCYDLNLLPNLTISYADFTGMYDENGNVRSSIIKYDASNEKDIEAITDFYNDHATFLEDKQFDLADDMVNFKLLGAWEYGEFIVYHFKYDDINGDSVYAICYIIK